MDKKKILIEEYDEQMATEGFWDDPQKAQEIAKQANDVKAKVEDYEKMVELYGDLSTMLDFLELGDTSFEEEFVQGVTELEKDLEEIKLASLLDGQYDANNCILSINAGSGGLDAQDWASMLWRMYGRWAEHKGYKVKILDLLQDPEAGIKHVTMSIEGLNAYGYLKSEKGVHRIVRISPYDSSGKRHTSFASVDVIPEMDDTVEIEIKPTDLRIDTYRASGAGGQHVNMTDSAVRITHIPTGIVVQCQNERSQHSNKETAMKMLRGKLYELKELEQKEKIEDLQGDYSQITWGSQIRSYVFHPYNLVKDHRTEVETGNIQAIMDGDIDIFINGYLNQKSWEK
ncbi:MAG: peptide chain release factor 2 [Clostridiales bacterium]|nr:peptide chain release factor 2 [Clostridiales bacterium]